MTCCLIIPHYKHAQQLINFLPSLLEQKLPIIIVDDGSDSGSISVLKETIADSPDIHLIEHAHNRGKGAAIKTALAIAGTLGFKNAIQIDADGQHNSKDIENFIQESKKNPGAIICGNPVFDETVPKIRLHGRKVTTFFVAIETLSVKIQDALCGFRLYPITQTECLLDRFFIGSRMDFDTDLIVKAVWANIPIKFIDTQVIYPKESVSHFNYFRENWLLIKLHTQLLLGMIIRSPKLIFDRIFRAT